MLDLVGFGSMDMQVGANEGQQLDIRINKLSLENLGMSNIDLSSMEGATDALGKMSNAINYVSSTRSRMGAYQNRLEHTISNLDITTENMTAAYSRIMDVDMAEEMTKYTTLQILVQASTSMLAQANERPSNVLQLLQ
jgi:flagellin